jgi:Ice-binding-like
VLAGSTVTNTGATTVSGNLGVDPGTATTGFPPGVVADGTIHAADAVALQAQNDTTTAYNSLAGAASNQDLSGMDLGGLTLTSGVYSFSSSAQLTGALTLDAQGVSSSVFVFQIGSTLTTASNSSVLVINGAEDCNIYWQVGSSAVLGTGTAFKGNILALTKITLDTGATVSGRTLASNGAVTMETNDVSIQACATAADAGAEAGLDSGRGRIDAGSEAGSGGGSSSSTEHSSGGNSGSSSSGSGSESSSGSRTESSSTSTSARSSSSSSSGSSTGSTDMDAGGASDCAAGADTAADDLDAGADDCDGTTVVVTPVVDACAAD